MIQKILKNEVFLYLVFGVATTLVYMITRLVLFNLIPHTLTVVFISNCVAILFAFITNDKIVFRQASHGWFPRLIKFISARITTLALDMFLAWLFVDTFPSIIGQFVHSDIKSVNAVATLISQILVIVLNYVLSKLFVFKEKK
ncbi:GtrA family protein [Streptococcus gallolyticus]|uniref:GtrA family protein n=1 Tax=Streptococcus hepaticus TaxID=3349163 RepID=UPI001C94D253|nr:GtrA family protein [Streptococcus gallolyticus]MBY5040378.1 GtrA family protein [Streptococcus gallolyticus]